MLLAILIKKRAEGEEKNWKRKMNGGRESGFGKKAELNGLRRLKKFNLKGLLGYSFFFLS